MAAGSRAGDRSLRLSRVSESASRVARFNIVSNTWSALSGAGGGNGVSSVVYALAVSDRVLYVGGGFLTANVGGTEIVARNLARYDTQAGAWRGRVSAARKRSAAS